MDMRLWLWDKANNVVYPCHCAVEWGKWFETADRIVARTRVGAVFVSTVFLGTNHQFGEGPPLLWETMAFRDGEDIYCQRYTAYEAALAGHYRVVKALEEGKGLDENFS